MQFEVTVPSVYDRVCQQALVNRLEPIFEKVFDPSSFGYRKGPRMARQTGHQSVMSTAPMATRHSLGSIEWRALRS